MNLNKMQGEIAFMVYYKGTTVNCFIEYQK